MKSPLADRWVSLDIGALDARDVYRLLISAVVPRPIAFVSTISAAGQGNLAPFSYFNAVSSHPPCVSVSVARKPDGSKKDTLRNIEETGEFAVNLVSEWLVEPMNLCSADYPHGVDEMAQVGLTAAPCTRIRPARVRECPVTLECVTEKIVEIGDGTAGSVSLVIGRIVWAHVAEEAYDEGRVRFEVIRPVARLGGLSYMGPGPVFDLPRPPKP